jgi:hypothetical protein
MKKLPAVKFIFHRLNAVFVMEMCLKLPFACYLRKRLRLSERFIQAGKDICFILIQIIMIFRIMG